MRTVSIFFTIFISLFTATATLAAEVLIVTWQGKLTSEGAFEDRLRELVPGVKFHYLDAERNKSTLAQKLRNTDISKIDLVYSFGTTGTKIVQQFLNGSKPLVFNIVTAPVLSDIVDSVEKPGRNTTGAQLLIDFKTQLYVLSKLRDFKTLGVWFDPREKQNSVVLDAFQKIIEAQGKKLVPLRIIPDSAQGKQMLADAVEKSNRLDAVYIIATSSFTSVYDTMLNGLDPKLLVMATVSTYTELGATVALGVEFKERGHAVAEQAAKILGGANAGEIPVSLVSLDKATLFANRKKMTDADLQNIDKLGMVVKLNRSLSED